jgi:hypothetical protein
VPWLTISLAIEIKISKNYLQVMEMDEHFKTADFENNILSIGFTE